MQSNGCHSWNYRRWILLFHYTQNINKKLNTAGDITARKYLTNLRDELIVNNVYFPSDELVVNMAEKPNFRLVVVITVQCRLKRHVLYIDPKFSLKTLYDQSRFIYYNHKASMVHFSVTAKFYFYFISYMAVKQRHKYNLKYRFLSFSCMTKRKASKHDSSFLSKTRDNVLIIIVKTLGEFELAVMSKFMLDEFESK